MLVRRLVVSVALAVGAFALPTVPSYAADPSDLYVATAGDGGDDGHACTEAEPCATVQHAIDLAASFGTTIHVGAGTFDGENTVGSKLVAIVGDSTDTTTLTAGDGQDGYVVGISSGTSTLSDLTLKGGPVTELYVSATGIVHADRVALTGALGCELWVSAGVAVLTDSVVTGSDNSACGDAGHALPGTIVMEHGGVTLTRSQVLDPPARVAAVDVEGGSFAADQTLFDDSANDRDTNDSDGIRVSGGSATVTRSVFHGFGSSGLFNTGGTSVLSDDTFDHNAVGVTSTSGSATVVRSTFQDEIGSLQQEDTGSLATAGSIMGEAFVNCSGTVTDLGYNMSADDSCAFTGSSRNQVDDLNLDTALADRGGPGFLDTVAIFWPSSAMDHIPAGATYGDDDQPLCPESGAVDLRGVTRPAGGACDAGSMEMATTVTTFDVPKKVKPHTDVDFRVEIAVPQIDLGLDAPNGFVTVRSGDQVLCQDSAVEGSEAPCSFDDVPAGKLHLTADFTPVDFNTVHPSSGRATLLSGTKPALKAPKRVTMRVGTRVTIRLHASGAPAPLIRKVAGSLPRGLSFHRGHGKATITGRPQASSVGSHHPRVRAINLVGQDGHRMTLVVTRR